MSQPVRLRMLDKLTGVVEDLARVDETLIEQHGLECSMASPISFLFRKINKQPIDKGSFLG